MTDAGNQFVPAWQLHVTDIVLPAEGDGSGRRVTGIHAREHLRCVEFAGDAHRVT